MRRRLILLAPLCLAAACQGHMDGPPPLRSALADMDDSTGMQVGTARIVTRSGKPALILRLRGIPAGPHGVHLHMVGKCDGPSFTSAGGHLNPAGHQHGTQNPAGHHMGDLPNVVASRNGQMSAEIPLDIDPGELSAALYDADGTALVVHAAADDYRSDPSGNAGARIACGVFQPE